MSTEMISVESWIQTVDPAAHDSQANIPIRVFGFDPGRIEFSEDTHTTAVGPRSVRLVLKNWVVMGEVLRVVNLENYSEADFRIVGPAEFKAQGESEWVMTCLDKGRNIWGSHAVFGPAADDGPGPVLECLACHSREEFAVDPAENEVLESTGMIAARCIGCGRETYWTYADPSKRPPAFPVFDDVAPPARVYKTKGFENTRKHKRLPLRLPVLVRNANGKEEISVTENISMGGFATVLAMELETDQIVTILCPYSPTGQRIEQKAECRWGASVTCGGTKRFYGFRYLG